jgi:hypothetical protein
MRDWAAHESEIAHAGQANIGDELAFAAQVAVVFQPGDRISNPLALAVPHAGSFPLARFARPSAY